MKLHVSGGFWLVLAMAVLLFPIRFLAGVILAAAVHELGHLAAIRVTGGRVLGMEFHAGGVRILTGPMEPRTEIICALAGPAVGALTILMWRVFPELAAAGLVQTLFNLLPAYPLDGGRILRNICCKRRDFGVQYGEHKDK